MKKSLTAAAQTVFQGDQLAEIRVGVIAVEPGGSVLACLRSKSKRAFGETWGVPGGKVDPGETLEAAARREFREETQGEVTQLVPVADIRHGVRRYFTFLAVTASAFTPELDHEHSDYKWARLSQWPTPRAPRIADILKSRKTVRKIKKHIRGMLKPKSDSITPPAT